MVLKKEVTEQITDLLRKNPQGLSIKKIVEFVKINRNTAGRYLENLLISGQVELRRFGMAKIYRISHRVPLSAVLSISSESVVQLDSFLRIIFANESFCTLVGTDNKNLVGKNIEYSPVALVFDDLFVKFIERIKEGVAGIEWSGEIELPSKGIILFCQIAPTVFDDGRRGVSVILEDITQRKQGEWALLESEATARALMNSPTDTVILMDTQGIILDLNETAAFKFKQFGDNLIGKLADSLLPHDVAHSRRKLTTQVREKKKIVRYEDERDNRWYDTVVYPIIVDGEVTRIAMIARDITDRKKSEDALRESEERYRQLVEISPDAVIIHLEGKITYLNQAALNMLGAKNSNEILGKNVLDLIHPDFRDIVRRNIEKDLNRETTPPTELDMLRLDGTTIIAEGRGVKTTFNGKPAIQVAIRDVTERKRVEMELRENERRLQLLLDSTEDLILMQDPEGRYLYFSATEAYGVTKEMILGSTPYELFQKETADRIVERVKKVVKTRQNIKEETSLVWKGQTLWFSDNLSPVKDKNGSIIAVVTISHNITDRKNSEKALIQSEERYRQLVDISPDAVLLLREGKIIFTNPAALNLLGASHSAEIIGKDVLDFIQPDFRDTVIKNIEKDLKGEITPPIELHMLHIDGTSVIVESRVVKTLTDGKPTLLIALRERYCARVGRSSNRR
jgi:PAS domain S-box-containing protein